MRETFRVSRAARAVSILLMPWVFIADGVGQESREERRRAGLVGVLGNWSAVNDGGPALEGDGTKWSGITSPAEARAHAQLLFGSVSDSFVSNATAPGAFPLAIWEDTKSFTEGTLRVQFKLVGGTTDQTAGVVFNLRPGGDYNFLRYNTKDGNLAVWLYANGERKVLTHGDEHAQLPLGAWHELLVTIKGVTVTGALKSGVASLSVTHKLDAPAAGRIGVWTKRDSVTRFRQFSMGR